MTETEMEPVAGLQPPERTVLSESVYETLREAILDGSLPPDMRVVEESLAKQLNTSRAPLREAIWRLKRDGLLVERSARDTRVVTLTPETIRELHLIRSMIESLAFQEASRQITDEELSHLERVVDDMTRAQESGDRQRLSKLDYEFHERMCRAARLPRLLSIWKQQHVLFRLWLNEVGVHHKHDAVSLGEMHRQLLEAVRSQDSRLISEQVSHHVYSVGDVMTDERSEWARQAPRITFENS